MQLSYAGLFKKLLIDHELTVITKSRNLLSNKKYMGETRIFKDNVIKIMKYPFYLSSLERLVPVIDFVLGISKINANSEFGFLLLRKNTL